MKVCHCVLPTINPLACKNCSNNTEEYEAEKMYSYEPLHMDVANLSKEEIEKLFKTVYPRSIPNEEVKENG